MYHLTVQQGSTRGATWALFDGNYRLGRGVDCDIVLAGDTSVSRVQCEMTVDGSEVTVKPVSDRSVTLLNGEVVVERVPLRSGDTLTVGFTTLIVSRAALGPNSPTPTTPDLNTRVLSAEESIYMGGGRWRGQAIRAGGVVARLGGPIQSLLDRGPMYRY